MTHYMVHKVGVRATERYQMLGQVGHYRLSVSVFGRKSRFTFGGTYGFGRMFYVTFGLFSVSAESKTSAFGRTLVATGGICPSKIRPSKLFNGVTMTSELLLNLFHNEY